MKKILTLALCFFISLSHADFSSAQKDYNNGNFETAFQEYLILAKYGNKKAQYNLAVMYAKGQGVERDLIQAYAWSKIPEPNPVYQTLIQKLEQDLTQDQLVKANTLHQQLFELYSFNNSKVILGPIIEANIKNDSNHITNRLIIAEKSVAPIYPKKMIMKNMEGWVDLSFRIYPDGSVRDINVLDETPTNSFAKEAVKAIEKNRYSVEVNGEKETLKEPQFFTQRIEFKLGHTGSELNKKQNRYLDNLISKAENGDIEAQYSYAYLFDTFLHKKGKIGAKKINQWLFNAAIDGIPGAQYRLGQNIYYGKACKVEKQKGLDWIMQAAHIGNANAQYLAYAMLKNKKVVNQRQQPTNYWLEQAAANGSNIAQLIYAQQVALQDAPSSEQLSLASEYLTDYGKKVYKTIQWYQINALVLNKLNKKSKAIKSMKKAIRLARSAGWDLSELNNQNQAILNPKINS